MKMWQRVRPHFSWANVSVAFFALVGLIGAVPYENNLVGNIFPVWMKPWVTPVCAGCAFLSRLFRSRHKETEEGKQVFNYYGSITSQGGNITIMRQPKKEVLQSDHSSL